MELQTEVEVTVKGTIAADPQVNGVLETFQDLKKQVQKHVGHNQPKRPEWKGLYSYQDIGG